MTTKLPQHGYVCSLDGSAGGSPVNISSSLKNADIDVPKGLGTVYTADTGFQQTVESPVKSCKVTLEVVRTTGVTEAYTIFRDWLMETNPVARTLTIDWPDSLSGSDRLTGEFSLESFQAARRQPGSGDPEILQAVLSSDGTFTWTDI